MGQSLDERLAALKQKQDGDYINAEDIHTLVEGIEYASGSGEGTSDYNKLESKPSINGHTLSGSMSSKELGIINQVLLNDGTVISPDQNGNIRLPAIPQATGTITSGSSAVPTAAAVDEALEKQNLLVAKTEPYTSTQKYNASANINDRAAVIIPETNEVRALGYKVLSPNLTLIEQIESSQSINNSYTIFEIRDCFDLNNTILTIPENCTLSFNGGKIINGGIRGNKTIINAPSYQIFNNITFSGNFTGPLNASWVGAKEGDATFDNSFVIQQWFDSYSTVFKTLEFDYGSYTFKTPVILKTDKRALKILGNNSVFSTVIPDDGDNGQFFITLQGTLQSNSSGGERFSLENIRFVNNSNTLSKTRCVMLNRTQRFSIKDVYMSYYDVAIWIRNCFYGGFYGNISLIYNRIGIYADSSDITEDKSWHEVNGIDFHNINITGCSIESAKALWPQNENESDDDYNMRVAMCGIDFHALCNGSKFYGNTFEHLSYGIRFSYKPYTSTKQLTDDVVTIDSCYFEDISTYSIYSGRGYVNNPNSLGYIFKFIHNIVISNCRFASNSAIYLKYGNTYFLNNQTAVITLEGDSGGNTYLVYNGTPTVNLGNYSAAHKVDTYFSQSLYVNSYQQLNALLKGRGIFTTATLDLSRADGNYNTNDPILIEEGSLGISPTFRTGDIIYPCSIKKYRADYYPRVSIRSGSSDRLFIAANARETLNIRGTRLRTFISDWLNVENQTVKTYSSVEGLWPFAVKSDPTIGLVKKVSDDTVVGFGTKAIEDGNVPTFSSSTNYCIFIEGLIRVACKLFNGVRYYVYYNDVVECGKMYTEIRPTPESGTSNTAAKAATKVFGTTADLASVQKRINAIYYDTDEHKTKIFNGTAWVELTDPWTRYFYNDIGDSLANRPEMAEFNGQEFYNKATGIRYTFVIASDKLSYSWRSSIGNIDSLGHPNGYDINNNHITYTTELSENELVTCNGKLYAWGGLAWKDSNGNYLNEIYVSVESVLLQASGASQTVEVYTNDIPTISKKNLDDTPADWLNTDLVGTTLTITAISDNTTENPREGKIILTNSSSEVVINVVQNNA